MKGNRLYLIFFIHNNIVLPKSVLIMCSSNCKNKKFIMNESMEIGVLYSWSVLVKVLSTANPVLTGGNAFVPFEKTNEVLWVLKSQFVSNLRDALFGMQQIFLGYIEHFWLDIFFCRFSRFFFYQITEIIGRQANLVGKILYGGNTVFFHKIRIEVIINQSFESA